MNLKNPKNSTNENPNQPETSAFSIAFDKPEPDNKEIVSKEPKKQRTRKAKKVIAKEFPIPLVNLAKILATLPISLFQKWIKSFPALSKDEETALVVAWENYLEYALEPDTITPAHALLMCYALIISSRTVTVAPEVITKIKQMKKGHIDERKSAKESK